MIVFVIPNISDLQIRNTCSRRIQCIEYGHYSRPIIIVIASTVGYTPGRPTTQQRPGDVIILVLGAGINHSHPFDIALAPYIRSTPLTICRYGTTGSAPTTDGTKVFSTLWLGFATLSLGHMVSKIIGYKLSSKIHSIRDRVLTHALDKDLFIDIDAFNRVSDGEIDRAEWLCYNLLKGALKLSCVLACRAWQEGYTLI